MALGAPPPPFDAISARGNGSAQFDRPCRKKIYRPTQVEKCARGEAFQGGETGTSGNDRRAGIFKNLDGRRWEAKFTHSGDRWGPSPPLHLCRENK